MRYIFGPIASRRFGMSLGIDLSPDKKSCNFDCIYCELEKSAKRDTIENPPKVKDVISEVKDAFSRFDFDVITITANGEPTLYPHLKELIEELNGIKEDKKLLILSNSSTISKKEIREALKGVDIAKLSLDSVIPKTFKKIDRGMKNIDINDIVDGIKKFSKEFKNELILEVLVVKSINDKVEEFRELNKVIKEINPTRVDISTIDRPPAYDVQPVGYEKLVELSRELEGQHIFIASRKDLSAKKESYTKSELLKTLSKRPFSDEDIKNLLDDKSKEIFEKLKRDGEIVEKSVAGVKFYAKEKK